MKKLFVFFSAAVLIISACSDDENPSKDGEEQIPQPVENPGPNLEGQRAVEATVNDSANSDKKNDSINRNQKKDSTRN